MKRSTCLIIAATLAMAGCGKSPPGQPTQSAPAAAAAPAEASNGPGVADPSRAGFYDALKGKKVVFVPMSMGFDLPEGWAAVLKKELDRVGATFEIRDPNWNTGAGAQAITSIIGEKPDILLVQNPDVQSYGRLLKRAQDAGIHVVQVNMKSSTTTDAFVGADWVGIGETAAQSIVRECGKDSGKSGKVALVQGALTAAGSAYQRRGIDNVLSHHPEIRIVSDQASDWDASKARSITATVIQQHPDLCGIIGFWDGHDIGTAAALREAGKLDSVYLVTSGGGAQKASCDNVSNGNFDELISYDVPGQARDLLSVFKLLLQTNPKSGSQPFALYSPNKIITKASMRPDSCWTTEGLKAN